ncbi:Ribosomal protein S18 acetylase RimI [Streptomyces sp. LamerLS-316]|uniref:GNAT family N-acetyltransferase n=1 Tax=unclassified Streptomyces TaxID=2593676 RepID=UPI000823EC55|nr:MULTISPECIES: GNAT family N-acetyltransferase [unclassified Streptomyces]MYQ37891.1 GNAT family N-acetyltransferase [Streptomyces sp. SID4921]SCK47636.1 Ribosomal protein S18 acetylase RimI [Streptomyces sp. LamerLS-316]
MIRTATHADLDAIVCLHTEARATYYRGHLPVEEYAGVAEVARSRDGWTRAVDRPEATVLCAEREGVLVGVAAYSARERVVHLSQLHVSPSCWRTGVGTDLHDACIQAWQGSGARVAGLEVFAHNTRAQSFYARHGWTPDPERPRTRTHLVLRLDLKTAESC